MKGRCYCSITEWGFSRPQFTIDKHAILPHPITQFFILIGVLWAQVIWQKGVFHFTFLHAFHDRRTQLFLVFATQNTGDYTRNEVQKRIPILAGHLGAMLALRLDFRQGRCVQFVHDPSQKMVAGEHGNCRKVNPEIFWNTPKMDYKTELIL